MIIVIHALIAHRSSLQVLFVVVVAVCFCFRVTVKKKDVSVWGCENERVMRVCAYVCVRAHIQLSHVEESPSVFV